jgi:hypothetical protein
VLPEVVTLAEPVPAGSTCETRITGAPRPGAATLGGGAAAISASARQKAGKGIRGNVSLLTLNALPGRTGAGMTPAPHRALAITPR